MFHAFGDGSEITAAEDHGFVFILPRVRVLRAVLPEGNSVFELDPRAGELRKKGMRIRLLGQPVEILVMLLERPGRTVTREELQKKLRPAETFVDFEQGLNNAIKRLRAALDDAESPHFIETLPRHGYRFIGTVNGAGQTLSGEAEPPTSRGSKCISFELLKSSQKSGDWPFPSSGPPHLGGIWGPESGVGRVL